MELNFKRVIGVVLFTLGISAVCAIAYEYTTYMLRGWMWTPMDVYIIIGGWVSATLGIVIVYMSGKNSTIQIGQTTQQTASPQ